MDLCVWYREVTHDRIFDESFIYKNLFDCIALSMLVFTLDIPLLKSSNNPEYLFIQFPCHQ